jgi:hypothetical protein
VGTTTGIVISVTDGTDSASLTAFDLEVTEAEEETPASTNTDDDDNCFIETAAYGSHIQSGVGFLSTALMLSGILIVLSLLIAFARRFGRRDLPQVN